jgi:long-chain acyl-CoA synthetase
MVNSGHQHAVEKTPFTAIGEPLEPFQPVHFCYLLHKAATDFPNRIALIFNDDRLIYRELVDLVDRAAAGLQALGIARGDRIGICMTNTPAAVIMLYAAMRAGGTAVMLSPINAAPALIGQARDADLALIATFDEQSELSEKVEAVVAEAGGPRLVVVDRALSSWEAQHRKSPSPSSSQRFRLQDLLGAGDLPKTVDCDPNADIALIQYSGGTTGAPKGVMLTHTNLHSAIQQFGQTLPLLGRGTEVMLAAGPLFHIGGLNGLLGPAIAWAATIVLIERFDPESTFLVCQRHGVTYVAAVPTFFFAMADYSEANRVNWSALKCVMSGGAPLPEAVKNRFERVVGKPLLHAYGLSECSPPVSVPPHGEQIPAACCGRLVPGSELQIRDSADPTKILPAREIGEICVRGPQVMKGYWRRPDETARAFVDGFVRTGDLGYVTEDRLLYIVDRLKDIIICSGFNVYPVRVEEAIFQHPAVSEVIVLGVPDSYRGETVKAFITLRAGQQLTLEQLQAFLKSRLSAVEMPKQLEIRPELPRTAAGKLSRLKLREEVLSSGH